MKHYESDKEIKFITYAPFWIRQAMQCGIERQGGTVGIPRRMQEKISIYKRYIQTFENRTGREPTNDEICRGLDISKVQLDNILSYVSKFSNMSSLDEIVPDTEGCAKYECIPSGENIEEDVVTQVMCEDISDIWKIVEQHTKPNENKVMLLRYGKDMTLQAAGDAMGITREAVRIAESKALRKLRFPSVKRLLQDKYEVVISEAYHSGVGRFKTTWTSSTERAALKLTEMEHPDKAIC